jgi:hypothetical protein
VKAGTISERFLIAKTTPHKFERLKQPGRETFEWRIDSTALVQVGCRFGSGGSRTAGTPEDRRP